MLLSLIFSKTNFIIYSAIHFAVLKRKEVNLYLLVCDVLRDIIEWKKTEVQKKIYI